MSNYAKLKTLKPCHCEECNDEAIPRNSESSGITSSALRIRNDTYCQF